MIKQFDIKGLVRSISFSPDGKYFVTGSYYYDSFYKKQYSYLNLYGTDNWNLQKQLGNIEGIVISLNFSPDGQYLACGRESNPLTVWDMNSQTMIKEYKPYFETPFNYGFGVFSNDSKYLLFNFLSYQTYPLTVVWDFKHDSLIYEYKIMSDNGLELSKDNNFLLIARGYNMFVMKASWQTTDIQNTTSKNLNTISIVFIKDTIHFEIIIVNPGFTNISIFDINGNKMQTFPFKYLEPGHYNFIRPSSLPTGVYFAVMQCGDNTISQQFEVVR